MYSAKRVHRLKMVILISLMLFLLSAPLYPLWRWGQEAINGATMAKIMVLQCSCTLIFGTVLSLCTRAKRHEIFAAAAT